MNELERLTALELRLNAEINRLDAIVNHAHRNRADDALASTLAAYNALVRVRDGLRKPVAMNEQTLQSWLSSINVPTVTDVFQASDDVFYVSFVRSLNAGDHVDQLRAIGIEVVKTSSPLKHRYMLRWTPTGDDENGR